MFQKQYIFRWVKSLWEETLVGKVHTTFIQNLDEKEIEEIIDTLSEHTLSQPQVIHYKMKNHLFVSPYHPFLLPLKEKFDNLSKEELVPLLLKHGVYPQQHSVFESYLLGQNISRKESMYFFEYQYEKSKMLESIWNLYFQMSLERPIIFIIEDLHYAPSSTLALIKYILERSASYPILLISTLDQTYQGKHKRSWEQWEEFIGLVEVQSLYISSEFINKKQYNYLEFKEKQEKLDLVEAVDRGIECFYFLAMMEARQYLTEVYRNRIKKGEEIEFKKYVQFLKYLAATHFYLEEYKEALLYYHELKEITEKENDLYNAAYANNEIGWVYFQLKHYSVAENFAKNSLQRAETFKDDFLKSRAYLLLYFIEKSLNRSSYEEREKLFKQLNESVIQIGYTNILSFIYTMSFRSYISFNYTNKKYFYKGLQIAKKNKNEFRLAQAYNDLGVVYSIIGEYKNTLKYFKESEKIRKYIRDPRGLAQIHNSIGFYYHMMGQYQKAEKYYQKSLNHLKATREFDEVGISFMNFAVNYYIALKPQYSIMYLINLITITNILKIKHFSEHGYEAINILIGLNYIKNQQYSKAYEYMLKIQNCNDIETRVHYTYRMFYFLFRALLAAYENQYDEVEQNFYMAEQKLINREHNLSYLYPYFYYEKGLFYKEIGQIKQADRIFKKGLEYSYCYGNRFYQKLFLDLLGHNASSPQAIGNTINSENFKWFIQSAKYAAGVKKLNLQVNEINFLHNIQTLISEEKDIKVLQTKGMELITNSFLIDASYIYLKQKDKWMQIYPVFKVLESMEELFSSTRKIINIPLFKNQKEMGQIIFVLKHDGIDFTEEDYKVLSIACKQLTAAIERIEQHNQIIRQQVEIQQANELDRMKTEFLSNISHEFRTPLNIIIGAIQLIELFSKEEVNTSLKYLSTMKQNALRLLRLVNNIIDMTRIDTGFMETRLQPHNIVTIVEKTAQSVVPYVEQRQIELEFDTEFEDKRILCDMEHLERILLNLLANAVKFTPAGGKITVFLKADEQHVYINIQDTGIGIPRNKIDMIFERFKQVDKSFTRTHEGSGIGLSLVKSLVEMQKGNIEVLSEEGKGSLFTIIFPILTEGIEEDTAYPEELEASLNRIQMEFSDIYT